MGKVIRLTESEFVGLVKKVIQEQKTSRPLIIESAAAQSAINDAKKRMDAGEKPDPKVMAKVKSCITQKQLTSLMFLTAGSSTYALGIVCLLLANPVGLAVGGVLALSSIIVLFITGLSEDRGGLGANPSEDVKSLLSCMGL